MATPVEYAQQYIPTSADIGMMQGQLDRMQSEYDTSFASQLGFQDEYSQLPSADLEGKQMMLGKFQEGVQGIVDRYGGDYGAASKDIARAISRERQKPFYQLAPQHAQRMEEFRQTKAKMGPYGVVRKAPPSKFMDDKGNITTTDFDYDIVDARAYGKEVGQLAKEHATSFDGTINQNIGGGIREVGKQLGLSSAEEARNYLATDPRGKELLENAYAMYGIQPGESPELDSYLETTLLGNLVGERRTTYMQDPTEAAARKASTKTSTPSYGPGIEFSELGKGGIPVVSTTRGRNKKNVINLATSASSTLNPDLNQAVKNEVLSGDVYVYSTSPDVAVEGKIKKGGQPITDKSVIVEEGTLQGYHKFFRVDGLEGIGPKAKKQIQAAIDNGDLESLGKGTLFATGVDGEGRSPLGIAGDDANISYDLADKGIITINQGTDEQINVKVSPFNGKVYTDNKGRTIVQGVGRSESMRAFGMGHGDDLINNGTFLKTDEPLIQAHLEERYNQLAATDPQKAKAMIMAAEYLKARQPVENVPEFLQKEYQDLMQAINQREFQSHRPLTMTKTISPEGF